MPDAILTPRESDVLCEIRQHLRQWKEAPTRLELARALSISRPTVELHLQRMARKGVLRLEKRWRGIALRA